MDTLKASPKRSGRAKADPPALYEPGHPTLAATVCFSVWIALMSIPMLSGAFLAAPFNDQYSSGYAYRAWAAEWWKQLGHVPLWNPAIFGGMPFVAGMHGDVLYPTAWLRLVLPTHMAMNLGFVIHYVLAGLFTYWFLRRWRVSWTGAVVGGLAYQLSGVIGSYVSPGHDGKLFVTAMLPLALLGLTLGIRDRRWEGFAVVALAVGLIMLSPHPQMAQYALLAAGIFTLFLVFGEGTVSGTRHRLTALALALAGVLVGVGVSAIQYIPFYAYIPYSPRATSVLSDFAWSSAYAIPWAHVPELIIPRFTGESFNQDYWGPNGLKLHSEYLGLAVVALAIVGAAGRERRRMVVWLLVIGALFLLIALGSATPFFRLWWEFVPFAKSMRAPGMALFIVSFVAAVLAAFGVDRVGARSALRFAPAAIVAGGVIAIYGATGALGAMAESLGRGVESELGLPLRGTMALNAAATIRWSATAAGIALLGVGLLGLGRRRGVLSPAAFAFLVVGIIGTDLWLNARAFWLYSNVHDELFAGDEIKARLQATAKPFRVWDVDVGRSRAVYPGAALMADDIAQLYGHHGNEPHAFDVLNGRQGASLSFARAGDQRILDLFAVNFLILQAGTAPDSVPGFRRTVSNAVASSGAQATLFERVTPVPYARFIPGAMAAPAGSSPEQSATTVLDEGFPVDRVVLFDSVPGMTPGAMPNPLPEAVDLPISFGLWEPGRMRLQLGGGAPAAGYVLVSENWDSEWSALVDGQVAPVKRGDVTLLAVPVAAGARAIELTYVGRAYARGRLVTVLSLLVLATWVAAPVIVRRWRDGRSLSDPG